MPTPARPAFPAGAAVPAAGFAIPATAVPVGSPERFVSSMSGGVVIDKDGAPAGRIPANAFVDTKDGTIYGPDGKAITIPEGSTVDFFDLPDIKQLMADAKNQASLQAQAQRVAELVGGGHTKGANPDTMYHSNLLQSHVDGQWGPGGVTELKGGAGAGAGCDMDHGPATKAGGAASTAAAAAATTTGSGTTTAVAGASGNPVIDQLNAQITSLMDQVRRLTPTPTSGGGPALAATHGAGHLGPINLLRLSVNDLVGAVGELNSELARLGIRGGGPGQAPIQFPAPPPKVEPPKAEAPKTEAPKTEVPKTEPPKTESSSSGSGSGSDDTRAEASSGSSSS